jgi:hypothetical protein
MFTVAVYLKIDSMEFTVLYAFALQSLAKPLSPFCRNGFYAEKLKRSRLGIHFAYAD